MKALVIGQGGREHALVRALLRSASIKEVHALPGSDGIAAETSGRANVRCHAIDWKNFAAVGSLAIQEKIDFVVIGPEDPLVLGLADALRARGIGVVGPSREAAQLEGSKIYCKEFLLEAGVPTARSFVVASVDETRRAAREFAPPFVLKADGLAAGKGVFICKSEAELLEAARSIFELKSLGPSGERALLEEFSPGYEISYLILTNGETFEPLPLAQDHKRLLDGDRGPNTGGMGVVSPVAIDPSMRARIDFEVVAPTLLMFQKRGYMYRGVLFIGLMMTERGPSVLEFNTRFGDPETQAVLPLLDGDWGIVFRELASGRLAPLRWRQLAACCVVLAAEGYPVAPVKGAAIAGLDGAPSTSETRYFIHAGTKRDLKHGWVTNGGRALCAVGLGADLREAIDTAYAQARTVQCKGMQMRTDIGRGVL